MAPMALSDSKVKTCSKTCLKNHETLKTQYDKLRIEHNKTEFDLATYKRGLASIEERLVFYKNNEVIFTDQIVVLKSDASFNEAEIIALKSTLYRTCCLFVPPIIDLSHSGIEKFKEPEFEGYGVKVDKCVSETSPKEIKKTPDAPIIEDWVSDDEEQDESKPKSEKKTVIPTVKKKEFVKAKQDDKTVRNTVKYAEIQERIGLNTVKASGMLGLEPKNSSGRSCIQNISTSVTLKRLDYIDAQGRFKSVMAWMDAQAQGRQECSKEKEESREECSKSRKTKKMKCLEESSQQRK
ncbi:hypothetical protein Tco_0525826 [Tanacetum coccineum]